ncbi:MAG: hypothetical protein V4563_17485 [Pseudomonadota bacterium]
MTRIEILVSESKSKKELARKMIDEIRAIICDSDPSPKMILQEPYRTILQNIEDYFYESIENIVVPELKK